MTQVTATYHFPSGLNKVILNETQLNLFYWTVWNLSSLCVKCLEMTFVLSFSLSINWYLRTALRFMGSRKQGDNFLMIKKKKKDVQSVFYCRLWDVSWFKFTTADRRANLLWKFWLLGYHTKVSHVKILQCLKSPG